MSQVKKPLPSIFRFSSYPVVPELPLTAESPVDAPRRLAAHVLRATIDATAHEYDATWYERMSGKVPKANFALQLWNAGKGAGNLAAKVMFQPYDTTYGLGTLVDLCLVGGSLELTVRSAAISQEPEDSGLPIGRVSGVSMVWRRTAGGAFVPIHVENAQGNRASTESDAYPVEAMKVAEACAQVADSLDEGLRTARLTPTIHEADAVVPEQILVNWR